MLVLVAAAAWLAMGGTSPAADIDPPPGKGSPSTALLGRDVDAEAVAAAVRKHGLYAESPGIGAGPCADCHPDVAAQWSASAHRFASFNNPYYVFAVDEFRRERGEKASRFCAGCHDPLLVATGAIDRRLDAAARARPEAQAGLVCLVCHSIDREPGLRGNGEYHATTTPVPGPKDRAAHKARLRPAFLGTARFCSTCHKVGLGPEITGDRWLRGQDDYDPWQTSAISGHGVASLDRPPQIKQCQDCHMPLEPAVLGDAAAKEYAAAAGAPGSSTVVAGDAKASGAAKASWDPKGAGGPTVAAGVSTGAGTTATAGVKMVRSHRFIAANTALPTLRGDAETVARVEKFLAGKVSADIGWVDDRRFDVVLRARGIGHRFPTGTMDSNEVWLEVEARDEAGRVIARSGGLGPDRALDPAAHLVRVQPVDGDGRPLLKRDPQHMRGVVWDNALTPSDPLAVRYAAPPATASVRARLLYRKFSVDYVRAACASLPDREVRRRCEELPVVEIARAEAVRRPRGDLAAACGGPAVRDGGLDGAEAYRRALEHGVALADALAEQAEEALPYLECAAKLEPTRPQPWIGRARLAMALGQVDEAVRMAREAARRAPEHPAPPYLEARAQYQAYRFAEARAPIERAAAMLPSDRNVLTLLSRIRGVNGDSAGALEAAERLLAVDPELDEGHYQRAVALRELGRAADSERAETSYLFHRVATEVDLDLRRRFRALYPALSDEDSPVHTHTLAPVAGAVP